MHISRKTPLLTARGFWQKRYGGWGSNATHGRLVYQAGEFYLRTGDRIVRRIDPARLRSEVYLWLEEQSSEDGRLLPYAFHPAAADVKEVVKALKAVVYCPENASFRRYDEAQDRAEMDRHMMRLAAAFDARAAVVGK